MINELIWPISTLLMTILFFFLGLQCGYNYGFEKGKEFMLQQLLVRKMAKEKQKRVLCCYCNKPIHIDRWKGVSKKGFFHRMCGNNSQGCDE